MKRHFSQLLCYLAELCLATALYVVPRGSREERILAEALQHYFERVREWS